MFLIIFFGGPKLPHKTVQGRGGFSLEKGGGMGLVKGGLQGKLWIFIRAILENYGFGAFLDGSEI